MEGTDMAKKTYRANLTLPGQLKERIELQTQLTGEGIPEFIRRCLLNTLEVTEAKQAELRIMENAENSGFFEEVS